MQVVLQTPSQLVVHEGRWNTVLVGAICTAAGGGFMWLRWTHPAGWSGNGGPGLVYFVGAVFVVVGFVIFWFSADRRYVIDRTARTASIVVQRLVHQKVTLLPFRDIDDVALEQSAGLSGNRGTASTPTFRVVFLMKDGSRVPWTPYSTSLRASQESAAAAARAFGGWTGNPETPSQPTTTTPALIAHPVATNWGCLAAFLSLFVAIGIGLFSLELYRVATWIPVPATVVSSDVAIVRGNKGNTYKPVVVYSYTYEGTQYQASAVTPVSLSAGEGWARSIASRYRSGSTTTAYVNPGHPNDAYLLHKVSPMPLLFVLFPVLFGLLFSWIVRVQRRQVQLTETHLVPVVNAPSVSLRR